MEKIRLGIVFGGKSSEHEVSRVSASHVAQAADRDKYEVVLIGITKKEGKWRLFEGPTSMMEDGSWEQKAEDDLKRDPEHFAISIAGSYGNRIKDMVDFVLPVLHGRLGEDGTIQGMFEMMALPYGGCSTMSSSVAMDKTIAKKVFEAEGIAQTPYIDFTKAQIGDELEKRINEKLRYPIFIKPVNMGSSVGITKVKTADELRAAIDFAAQFDNRFVAEQGVNCRELEVAVMGRFNPKAYEVGEVLVGGEFYDYADKYKNGVSRQQVPADIPQELREKILRQAEKAYAAIGCDGMARVDFLLDKDSGELYINEINTIPGFTPISMFPMMMRHAGYTYPQIIDKLVELGMERYRDEKRIDA